MKKSTIALGVLALIPLASCGGDGDDALGDRVENAADERATAMEDRANELDENAEDMRDTAEARADAIDAANLDADAMTQEERNAIIANEAPAVE